MCAVLVCKPSISLGKGVTSLGWMDILMLVLRLGIVVVNSLTSMRRLSKDVVQAAVALFGQRRAEKSMIRDTRQCISVHQAELCRAQSSPRYDPQWPQR